MDRLPRVVLAGAAHHVKQRGNRRPQVFLEAGIARSNWPHGAGVPSQRSGGGELLLDA